MFPESCSTLHQLCIMLASCQSLRCSWRKKPVSFRESKGLVTDLRCPRFVTCNTVIDCVKDWITGYWLCSQLWHVTAAHQRPIVEIEFLETVSWKWGCRPFSCPCENLAQCQKRHCLTCLSKESMPAIPFWISKPPLPTRSMRSLRAAARSTSSAVWLDHTRPFVAAAEKRLVSCREAEGLVTELCLQELLQHTDCALSCAMWLLHTKLLAANFNLVGWKRGCQPFSCGCSDNVTHCRKEVYATCYFV